MDLNLPARAETCAVTGQEFGEDEKVVSVLVREEGGEGLTRRDVRAAAAGELVVEGRVACRWVHLYKPKRAGENPERELKLTAENLFLTLADPSNALSVEEARLVQFMALMLERKRVLRPKGLNAAGTHQVYEHAGTKGRYEVPAGELSPEFFVAVQEQLSVLVGETKTAGA